MLFLLLINTPAPKETTGTTRSQGTSGALMEQQKFLSQKSRSLMFENNFRWFYGEEGRSFLMEDGLELTESKLVSTDDP